MGMAEVCDPQRKCAPGKRDATTIQLSFSGRAGARGLGAAVTAREFFDSPGRIDELLFPGEKRVASRADADSNVLAG
jgi:hypothetical protein